MKVRFLSRVVGISCMCCSSCSSIVVISCSSFCCSLLRRPQGLEMHKRHGLKWVPEECSLRMLDSCVKSIPTGNEKGVFYALDFGGTNVRAVRCELIGGGKVVSKQFIKK